MDAPYPQKGCCHQGDPEKSDFGLTEAIVDGPGVRALLRRPALEDPRRLAVVVDVVPPPETNLKYVRHVMSPTAVLSSFSHLTRILPVIFLTVQKSMESRRTTDTKTPMKLELNMPPKR